MRVRIWMGGVVAVGVATSISCKDRPSELVDACLKACALDEKCAEQSEGGGDVYDELDICHKRCDGLDDLGDDCADERLALYECKIEEEKHQCFGSAGPCSDEDFEFGWCIDRQMSDTTSGSESG